MEIENLSKLLLCLRFIYFIIRHPRTFHPEWSFHSLYHMRWWDWYWGVVVGAHQRIGFRVQSIITILQSNNDMSELSVLSGATVSQSRVCRVTGSLWVCQWWQKEETHVCTRGQVRHDTVPASQSVRHSLTPNVVSLLGVPIPPIFPAPSPTDNPFFICFHKICEARRTE